MLAKTLITFAAAAAMASPVAAASFTYTGDTTGAPTYNRSFDDFSGLSFFGQNVNYDRLDFTVDTSGSYDFLSEADGWDNFLFLYSPSFDPGDAMANGVIGNDDFGTIGVSAFSVDLTAGVSYVLVTTGFEGGLDFGAYTNTIDGPGNVIAVPEPQAFALMALGLAAIGAWTRRRRAG